ncbi:MAG: SMP-30/gluconolactonase/LRE family protein [Acidobacteriota bacterium]
MLLTLQGCTGPDVDPSATATGDLAQQSYETFGSIERIDARLDDLIPQDAALERLSEGFEWSEGPVWVPRGGYLLFSDIPQNSIFKWQEGQGISLYMKPSGYTGASGRGGEPGTNGLTLDSQGRLVMCEHGDRRVSREESPGEKVTLADNYQGKRFNSPNDLCFKSNGDLYFTDPPYGLEKGMEDPAKDLEFQGVYRLSPEGEPALLTDELTRPNGIAFSPDEQILYVANSDPERAIWMAYDVQDDGSIANGRVFFDVTQRVGQEKGLPDGLKVDQHGNLFATGPGGVLIFAPDGTHLGTIRTGEATANCAWGDDGSSLYITADMYLARVKTGTRGAGWE